jgi:transcription elongation factor GreA
MDESEIDLNIVSVGSTVVVRRVETGANTTYQLVGSFGADPLNGKISDESPIGSVLKGARVGETVEVTTPNGKVFHLEVVEITR